MTDDRTCLYGEVDENQVATWDALEWRRFQFRHMVNTNKRLSRLEKAMSWRALLLTVPWLVLGGVVSVFIKCF